MTLPDVASLFGWQFLTGLILSVLAPVLGVYLRLRNEWLAALGYTHVAAAGGVIGAALHWLVLPAALVMTLGFSLLKTAINHPGNSIYASMILVGWSAMMIAASSHHGASHVGQALIDGQLYFTGPHHFVTTAMLSGVACMLLYWLSPRLLLEVLFPGHLSGNMEPIRLYNLLFDLLAAITVAVTAISVGIMAAFALVFLPAWVAFRIGTGWRTSLYTAVIVSLIAYLAAFYFAMMLDQPFGPVMVISLFACALLALSMQLLLTHASHIRSSARGWHSTEDT